MARGNRVWDLGGPWKVAAFKSKTGWFVGLPDNGVTTNFGIDALMEFHVSLNCRTICMRKGGRGAEMKIVSIITDLRVVDRILRHLESQACRARDPFEPRAPPQAGGNSLP